MFSISNEICPFLYLGRDRCPLQTCCYSHKTVEQPLCAAWTKGECDGYTCRERHYYTEGDNTQQPSVQQNSSTSPTQRTRLLTTEFNSPYIVRIDKETEKRKRIEVDLETGHRFSFDETVVKEVLDLTGIPSGQRGGMNDVFSPLSPSCIVYSSRP